MPEVELTAEQRDAIFAPGNLLVLAGAGSGKTEVLARRFVALLTGEIAGQPRILPEQIAAITFTEKAAIDIRQRIAQVLQERMRQASADSELTEHLARAHRLLPLARISTIHAFCARMLREHPLEAGLDPDFAMLDENASLTYLERYSEQLLLDALRSGDPGAVHIVSSRGLRGGTYRLGAVNLIVDLIAQLARMGRGEDWLMETTRAGSATAAQDREALAVLVSQLCALVDDLVSTRGLSPAAEHARQDLESRWKRGLRARIARFNGDSGSAAIADLRELAEALPKASGKAKEKILAIRRLLENSAGRIGLGGTLIGLYGKIRAAQPALDTAKLIARVAGEIRRQRHRDSLMTFDDLLASTLHMLMQRPEVLARYRALLNAILVDEYQDTDGVQDAIVELLTGGRGPEPAPALFIVGDRKQAIYRFRGADVTVISRPRSPQPSLKRLSQNRRAVPNIIEFVNLAGAHTMRTDKTDPDPSWVLWNPGDRLTPHREPLAEPTVELMLTGDSGEGKAHVKRQTEAREIAQRCIALVRDRVPVSDPKTGIRAASWRDIVILLRAFTDVALYEQALRRQSVPSYTVRGRGFYQCPEVIDLMGLLAAINGPDDSLSLAAALRSPLFALSDRTLVRIALHQDAGQNGLAAAFRSEHADFEWLEDERANARRAWQVITELRATRDRCPIVELLEQALVMTDYEAVMLGLTDGRQRLANVRKLVAMAREFEKDAVFGLNDFIRQLRRLIETDPNESLAQILGEQEDVVRLMTIHQAKGLEFPVVFLADMARGRARLPNNYVISDHEGLLLCETVGSGPDELPNQALANWLERLKQREEAERARLLYVAITRARDRLILSEGGSTGEWTGQIRALVGKEQIDEFLLSGETVREVTAGDCRIALRRPGEASITQAQATATVAAPALIDEQLAALAQQRLGFEPPVGNELIMSPTQLADFDRCPRQFYYRHVLALPEAAAFRYGASDSSRATAAVEKGQIVHAVLEQIDFRLKGTELRAALRSALDINAGALAASERDALERDLWRYLDSRDRDEPIAGREVAFFMALDGGDFTLYVRGQIDVLLGTGAGRLVRDYKYAAASKDHVGGYQVQMEAYALAAAEDDDERPVRAQLVFLRDKSETVDVPIAAIGAVHAHLLALGRAARDARRHRDYPKKPSGPEVCRQLECGFTRRCWRSGGESTSDNARQPALE